MSRMNIIVAIIVIVVIAVFIIRSRPDISDGDAHELVKNGATLIDVRSPGEFASGHVEGAINIPVGTIASRVDEVPRDKPVVLYCRSGARSAQAASALKAAGFEQVHNVGAMPNW